MFITFNNYHVYEKCIYVHMLLCYLLVQASRIILATGSDDYLKSLAEELARRIGRERLVVQMNHFLLLDMQTHFCFEFLGS